MLFIDNNENVNNIDYYYKGAIVTAFVSQFSYCWKFLYSEMTSRMVYVLLNTAPLFLILLVMAVFIFIALCSLYWDKDKLVITSIIILAKFAKGIFGGKTGIFSDMSIKVEKDEWGIPLVYIHGKKVPYPLIAYVGILALILYLYIGLAFWDVFFLKESSDCDTEADCFVDGGGNDPVDNCTGIILEGDHITVTCYKYVFDIGTAIGVSGGTITALRLTFSAVAGFWLFWYDFIKKKGAFKICVLLQYIIALFAPVIFVLVTLVIPNKYLQSFQLQKHVVIQICCLSITLLMSLAFPWWRFSQDSDSQKFDSRDSDSKETMLLS